MGVMSERRSNSSAAVKPAGPAPAITATLPLRFGTDISTCLSSYRARNKKHLTTGDKVACKRKSCCDAFGYYVMKPKISHRDAHDAGIERKSDRSDPDEACELGSPIPQPALLERNFYR